MGLPIKKYIASTNINKIVPEYLRSGIFSPTESIQTISNAMDVGNPSNFERILDLFNNSFNKLKDVVNGFYYTDDETKAAIKEIYLKFNYVVDPHGAIGYLGMLDSMKYNPDSIGVFLGTAHTAKFLNIVEPVLNTEIEIPKRLQSFIKKTKIKKQISNFYDDLKNRILEN